jgi:hypothetical protein
LGDRLKVLAVWLFNFYKLQTMTITLAVDDMTVRVIIAMAFILER